MKARAKIKAPRVVPKFKAKITIARPPMLLTKVAGKQAPKKVLTLRLDAPLADYLRSTGPGWQTRFNAFVKQGVQIESLNSVLASWSTALPVPKSKKKRDPNIMG